VHLVVESHDGAVRSDVFGGSITECTLDLRGNPPKFPENPWKLLESFVTEFTARIVEAHPRIGSRTLKVTLTKRIS
jgi:hypothetical protein